MADIVADGNVRVMIVPSIANTAAPTVAELGAGTHVTEQVTKDGLEGFDADTARVSNEHLGSTRDTEIFGTAGLPGAMLRFKDQGASDTTKTTLARGTRTYIVLRRNLAYTTAVAASQAVAVYPVECGERKDLKPEKNTLSRYEIPLAMYEEWEPDAVVAA